MDDVLAVLRRHPKVKMGAGVDDKEIVAAEAALGLRFPSSFRRYLAELGWVTIDENEIYGLGPGVSNHCDLVRVALSERAEMEPPIPLHLLPLMNDGGGNHYCLDVSDAVAAVVFFDHELTGDQITMPVAPSFDAWLLSLLGEEDANIAAILADFKRGIAEVVPSDDVNTRFDLGIAYREMGLLDDAIVEFELAAEAPALRVKCVYYLGLAFRDQARFTAALDAFERVVTSPLGTAELRDAAHLEIVALKKRGPTIQ